MRRSFSGIIIYFSYASLSLRLVFLYLKKQVGTLNFMMAMQF